MLLATLGLGVALGVALDRGGPYLSAQAARAGRRRDGRPRRRVRRGAGQGAERGCALPAAGRQYEQFQHVNRTFELVARAVSPAVVHIVAHKTGRSDEVTRVRHFEETGSGVIVRADRGRGPLRPDEQPRRREGAPPTEINIFLQDGRSIHPDRVWLDAKADIAVLNLGRDDLPAARLGDSDDVAVGSWVLALGSPFGLTHSVSQGIISARGRHMDELARTSRTRTSSRPTRRSTRATRAARWST